MKFLVSGSLVLLCGAVGITCSSSGTQAPIINTDGGTGADGSAADGRVMGTPTKPDASVMDAAIDAKKPTVDTGPAPDLRPPYVPPPPECMLPKMKLTLVTRGGSEPMMMLQAPGDDRLFVVQRRGLIRILKDGQFLAEPFLDMRTSVAPYQGAGNGQGERGLLTLAFHPDFTNNGRFYVFYTRAPTDPYFVSTRHNGDVVIAEGTRSTGDANKANPELKELISIQHDGVNGRNGCCDDGHNGGMLVFDKDGYLLAGVGDGGGSRGAYVSNVTGLATILRLNVDDPTAKVPGNIDRWKTDGFHFVWAPGVRNPWKASVDPMTGDIYFGDVGEAMWEEVNRIPRDAPAGQDFGWTTDLLCAPPNGCMEGTRVVTYYPYAETGEAVRGILPIHEFDHDGQNAIVGGVMYRGNKLAKADGHYFFGDYVTNRIYSLYMKAGAAFCSVEHTQDLVTQLTRIQGLTGFALTRDGILYVHDLAGNIYTIDQE